MPSSNAQVDISTPKGDGDGGPGQDAVRLQTLDTRHDVRSDVASRLSDVTGDEADGHDDVLTELPFAQLLSSNQYTVRKMAAQAMMDVALMMANISQLRTLLAGEKEDFKFFWLLLGLVVFSLVSQLVFGILIFVIWVRESTAHQREQFEQSMRNRNFPPGNSSSDAVMRARLSLMRMREQYAREVVTNRLNHVTMVLVFLITVANMFVTGFGIEPPSHWPSASASNATSKR